MDNKVTIFICGKPIDHKCDKDGPVLCGGIDSEGNAWQDLESNLEARKKATWGSVSCSVCGRTAQELSYWSDW